MIFVDFNFFYSISFLADIFHHLRCWSLEWAFLRWMEIFSHLDFLRQCFPTFFCSRTPYLVMNIFGGTPSWFDRSKDQGIVTLGDTPGTSSLHPCGSNTPVGNHCSKVSTADDVSSHLSTFWEIECECLRG